MLFGYIVSVLFLLRIHDGIDLAEIFGNSAATQVVGSLTQLIQNFPFTQPAQLGLFTAGSGFEIVSWARLLNKYNSYDQFFRSEKKTRKLLLLSKRFYRELEKDFNLDNFIDSEKNRIKLQKNW